MENNGNPPPGWSCDRLTKYFDDSRKNKFATYHNKKNIINDLINIDRMFAKFLENPINPRPLFPMSFFLRAHSAYRVAAGAAMAGQVYELQALLRLCLEHAAYGFYIGADKDRHKRWMARHEGLQERKVVRDEFTHKKVRDHLRTAASTIGATFEKLYETTIDLGAHPNEQGFSMSSNIRQEEGSVHLETVYLHGDGLALDHGLKMTAQVGLCVLHIAQLLYTAKFELLGIKIELEKIRKRH